MKRITLIISIVLIINLMSGCQVKRETCQIAATTLPVYEFTASLCEGTGITVCQIVTEGVSCLHDYTLQASQMRLLESAEIIVISGGGLEDFLEDALTTKNMIVDASENIQIIRGNEIHDHSPSHTHEADPHIWLSPTNAQIMSENIYNGLVTKYPEYVDIFSENLFALTQKFEALQAYGAETLSNLSVRELITFHDGFSYFAHSFDLKILKAIEEDSGSEASAAELKELINLIKNHNLPAIFTETNGSTASANTICAETGISHYVLDMAMSTTSYFDAMYQNIDTVKEALK